MSGILRLESLTKGNTLKQGDKTPLKYRLFDADGEKLNIAGKSATVRLVYPDFLTIGYEKGGLTVAQDDTVTFTIDNVIPSRIYHVEIIVDEKFIFPSRADESKFTVDKSSLGTEANIVEIVGVDAVVRKAVDLINQDPSLIIDEDKLVGDIISNTGIGNIDKYYKAFNDLKPRAELSISQSAEALTKSQNALNVANGIDAKATNALSLSESADTLSKSVQEQFNQVIIDGDSSVEAAQARVDASGQTNPTLKARLDKEHNEVTAQLEQTPTSQELYSNLPTPGSVTVSATNSNLSNGFITFIDDDGFSQYYTTLAPMLEERGFRGVTAVISGTMNTSGRMTSRQLRELQEKGHEIASHTHDHIPFGQLTPQQIEFQCRTAKEILTSEGFLVDSIIYPYGQTGDVEGKRIIKKYYRAGATAGDASNKSQNKILKDEFEIKRVNADTATLEHLKMTVDECATNKTWLMFMTHANTHNAERTAIIGQLLDYIKTKSVQVGTMREGLDIFGNTFSVGSKEYIKVLSDGSIYSNSIGAVFRHPKDGYDITENTPLYDFEVNKITYSYITTTDNVEMPSPANEGVLTTYHLGSFGAHASYQTWVQYAREAVYKRRWMGTLTTGEWAEWRTDTFSVIIPNLAFDARETKVVDIDISKAGGGLTNQTPIVATSRSAIIDNFSYNIRIASPTTAKLRITNLTDNHSGNQLVLWAGDWDIRVFRK